MFPSAGGASFSPTSVKVIRLIRHGCANRPFFHISVMEKKKEPQEPVIEQIGSYDPLPNQHNEKLVAINFERLEHWIRNGALVTSPVSELLGLCGYFPVHYNTFQNAWKNRLRIKERLDDLNKKVAEINESKMTSLPQESTDSPNLNSTL